MTPPHLPAQPGSAIQLAPAARRVVVVSEDDAAGPAHSSSGAAIVAGGLAGAAVGGPFGAIVGAIIGAAAGSDDDTGMWRLGLTEARSHFAFPPGHPSPGEAYALHPHVSYYYLPLGSFHRYLREAKQAEFMKVLAALGATQARVKVLQSEEKSTGGSIRGSVPLYSVSAEGKAETTSAHKSEWTETFEPRALPHVPDNCIWLAHEPSWLGLVERRIQYRTTQASARFEYVDDFDVTASVAAKVKGIGGKISGSFQECERIAWELEVQFLSEEELRLRMPPPPKPWWKPW